MPDEQSANNEVPEYLYLVISPLSYSVKKKTVIYN